MKYNHHAGEKYLDNVNKNWFNTLCIVSSFGHCSLSLYVHIVGSMLVQRLRRWPNIGPAVCSPSWYATDDVQNIHFITGQCQPKQYQFDLHAHYTSLYIIFLFVESWHDQLFNAASFIMGQRENKTLNCFFCDNMLVECCFSTDLTS